MPGINDFKGFALSAPDTYTPAQWAALTSLLAAGFTTGVASTKQVNTAFRQFSSMAAALGKIIADAELDALDDGNVTSLADKLIQAFSLSVGDGAGVIKIAAGNYLPLRTLKTNGAAVNRVGGYANLFAKIGTTFGAGNGSSTFNLPDLRGVFLRGWDDGRGVDSGRAIATLQGHALQDHAHQGINYDGSGWDAGDPGPYITGGPAEPQGIQSSPNSFTGGIRAGASIAAETRPVNVAVQFVISY